MNISGSQSPAYGSKERPPFPCGPADAWNGTPGTRNRKRHTASGFTLVELLVSVTVLSLLMLMLFGFFDQATKAWQMSEKKIDASREVRAALYFLKRDLENMIVDDKIPWYVQDDPSATSGLVADTSPPPTPYGDVLFFISAQSPEAQDSSKNRSDLCAVGYYLSFQKESRFENPADPQSLSARSYKLYRYFKSSDDTWVAGKDAAGNPSKGLLFFLKGPSASIADLFINANSTDEIIARNVINFSVVPYDAGLNILPRSGPSNTRPAFVEISLSAFNYDTAEQLSRTGNPAASQNNWHRESSPATWSALGSRNIQNFKTRVSLAR